MLGARLMVLRGLARARQPLPHADAPALDAFGRGLLLRRQLASASSVDPPSQNDSGAEGESLLKKKRGIVIGGKPKRKEAGSSPSNGDDDDAGFKVEMSTSRTPSPKKREEFRIVGSDDVKPDPDAGKKTRKSQRSESLDDADPFEEFLKDLPSAKNLKKSGQEKQKRKPISFDSEDDVKQIFTDPELERGADTGKGKHKRNQVDFNEFDDSEFRNRKNDARDEQQGKRNRRQVDFDLNEFDNKGTRNRRNDFREDRSRGSNVEQRGRRQRTQVDFGSDDFANSSARNRWADTRDERPRRPRDEQHERRQNRDQFDFDSDDDFNRRPRKQSNEREFSDGASRGSKEVQRWKPKQRQRFDNDEIGDDDFKEMFTDRDSPKRRNDGGNSITARYDDGSHADSTQQRSRRNSSSDEEPGRARRSQAEPHGFDKEKASPLSSSLGSKRSDSGDRTSVEIGSLASRVENVSLASKKSKKPVKSNQEEKEEVYGEKIEPSSMDVDFYYGKHPVRAAMEFMDPDILSRARLIVQEGSDAQGGEEMQRAKEMGVRIEISSKMRMNEVLGGQPPRPHQGLILEMDRFDWTVIKRETTVGVDPNLGDQNLLMIALDEVADPMNVGAILRSSLFFGVYAVIASTKNSAPLTATVAKTSAGASFVFHAERRLLGTRNLVQCLQAHKSAGWRVVGTSAASSDGADSNVVSLDELPKHPRTILVMGNEESGLRKLVRAECDALIHLPRVETRPPPTVASIHQSQETSKSAQRTTLEQNIALNVSAATAAILSRLTAK